MASVSSPGIGSGLDVNGIISKLMAVESQPLTALDTKEASVQAQISEYGTLQGAVSSLESAAFALTSTTLYAGKTASSSDTTVASVSANTAAATGTHQLNVIGLAQPNTIASGSFTDITSNISTVDGKIKIELGTLNNDGSVTDDPNRSPVTIDVAANSSSLASIRDAINAANAGVTASTVYVGGTQGYKLTLTSNATGANTSIKLTTTDSSGNPLTNNQDIARLSYDPSKTAGTGNEFSVTSAAQDAHVQVDGVDLYRSSNTISDAIGGVTLNLLKSGASSTISIAQDTTSATSAMTAFVTAYNTVNTQLQQATAYNASTGQGGILLGDSAALGLQNTLSRAISYSLTGSGAYSTLSSLGVSVQRDGSLVFDSSKLTAALSADPAALQTAMTATTPGSLGLAANLDAQLKNLISDTGIFASKTDGLNRNIKDIDNQRLELQQRLTQIEANYRAQYTALDTLIASMQQTSQYLTQQLASLPSTSK